MTWDLHQLFRMYGKEITRSLRRRGLSPDSAADITQETFLRVLTSRPTGSTEQHNPRAYLHRVSRNLSVSQWRRDALVPMTSLEDETLPQFADPSPGPEQVVYSRERLALTMRALAELPPRTREAFELHRLGDKTIAEIARRLGLSTTRTWALIQDAYRHLLVRVGDI